MDISIFGERRTIDEGLINTDGEKIREQVKEYESGERTSFDLNIVFPSDFTGRVMKALDRIPYGETQTYGDIARTVDTAPVAIGGACSRNPIPIIVPCHRVVGVDSLVGYQGGLALKQRLLRHEGAELPGN